MISWVFIAGYLAFGLWLCFTVPNHGKVDVPKDAPRVSGVYRRRRGGRLHARLDRYRSSGTGRRMQ